MLCARCKEERPLPYRVTSEILSDLVCANCATAARALDLEVTPIARHAVEPSPIRDLPLLYLLGVWIDWRKSHDVESAKLCCCEKSKRLFDALNALELSMIGDDKLKKWIK